jgi:hypothetical protein
MENLDLLNSELLENQFYILKDIGRNYNQNNNTIISGYTYSTGVAQPISKIEIIK